MREAILSVFDRLVRRAVRQTPPLIRRLGDSFNLEEIAYLKAAFESASYYEEWFSSSAAFGDPLELMTAAVGAARPGGLFLEFGVATGRTIRHLASRVATPIYGFDSFEGLPEDWRTGYGKGAFCGAMPEVPGHVTLVKGLFSETLPGFLAQHREAASFVHIDCDLYSSTKCVFELLGERIGKGTVLQFDEYWNFPGWKQHEFKALEELKEARGFECRAIGFVPDYQQVAFVVE